MHYLFKGHIILRTMYQKVTLEAVLQHLKGPYSREIDERIELENFFIPENPNIDTLDNLSPAEREGLCAQLVHLPIQVLQTLGQDIPIWFYFASTESGDAFQQKREEIEFLLGLDVSCMRRTRKIAPLNWSFKEYVGRRGIELSRLIEQFECSSIDAGPYVIEHGQRSPAHYAFNRLSCEDVKGWEETWWNRTGNGLTYKIFLDGPMGFGLFYKGHPQAVISFNLANPGKLRVTQMQGIRPEKGMVDGVIQYGHSRGLMGLNWTWLLLHAVEDWARSVGIAEMQVQPANRNQWVQIKTLSLEAAHKIYDFPAMRRGYVKHSEGGFEYWKKAL